MKLASSSTSFDAAIAAGTLTQLEWLDLCATELGLDGVVFAAQHFPRTDADYVAQLKKMATDLGLTVAAFACDAVLAGSASGEPDAAVASWLEVAWGLGAPIVVAGVPAASDDPGAWASLVASSKAAAAAAKRRNVTLAVRNGPGTLCSGPADLKQLAKEVDGSWLRFAVDVNGFEPGEPIEAVLAKAVIATHTLRGGDEEPGALRALATRLSGFRAFLVIDAAAGAAGGTALAAAMATLRRAEAERALLPASAER